MSVNHNDREKMNDKFKMKRILEQLVYLSNANFTGTVTVEFNMKNGGAGGVYLTTKERL